MVFKDPDAVEIVGRAEGKYRRRDISMTDGLNWLSRNRVKQLPTLGTE